MIPRPDQEIGVERLLKGSLLLADEPGCGKTAQVCLALSRLPLNYRVGIVVRQTLIPTWFRELDMWFPNHGFERWILGQPKPARFITHFETLAPYKNKKVKTPYLEVLVVDEAHDIKNRKAQRSNNVHRLAKTSGAVWLLTGSPVLNRADELWYLLHTIAPKMFTSYWQFVQKWQNAKPGKYGWVWDRHTNDPVALGKELSAYVLRRPLEGVPDCIRSVVPLEMTTTQRKLYKDVSKQLRTEIEGGNPITITNLLTRTTRLRQISVTPRIVGVAEDGIKFRWLQERIDDTDDKIVLFSQWSTPLKQLEVPLAKHGYSLVTGDTKPEDRETIINDWRTSDKRILALTQGIGGVGLTLTESATVILLDESWTPNENDQAISRLVRHGQKRKVVAYIPRCVDSVEEHVADLNFEKRVAADTIMEQLEKWAK